MAQRTEKEILDYWMKKDSLGINWTQEDRIIFAMRDFANQQQTNKPMAQTAVDWLVNQEIVLDLGSGIKMKIPIPHYVIEQAKAMEKEQSKNDFIAGIEFIPVDPKRYDEDAEQYYKDAYGTNNQQ